MPAELLSEPLSRTPPASVASFQSALRHQARNERTEAARDYLRAIELHPPFFEAAYNLGVLLQEMGQCQDAVGCYRHALQSRPDLAPAWGNLGVALRDSGLEEDAASSFRQALRLHPGEPGVLNNLGNLLLSQQQHSQAIACFRKALRRAPANAGIHMNLGNALRASGRVSEAVQSLLRAVQLQPDCAEAHWDLAFALLLQGDFANGFREYEWRSARRDFPRRHFDAPVWMGEDLGGRTLLVHTEQGAGDGIQFVRFVSDLPRLGTRVVLECPSSLARLFETVPGVAQVVRRGETLPDHARHVSLLSLPYRLGVRPETIPTTTPYLRPPPGQRVSLPPPPVPRGTCLRVGVAWRGNPKHPNDRRRSIPLSVLEPLFAVAGVAFYNLQVSAGPEFAGESASQPALVPLGGRLGDFAATASIVSQLDLVISADTSVAHLAGALGRAAWILLPFAPDWRWLLDREDTPWYPTLRLFRQSSPGDWTGVIHRIRDALIERVGTPCV